MNKKFKSGVFAINKKARLKYQVLETIEAGLILNGAETKSIKNHQVNLGDAFAQILGGEIWLIGTHVSPYKYSKISFDPKRSRKLLLNKAEILQIAGKLQKGLTLVPLKLYSKKNRIKLELGLARGLKTYHKKQILKERDLAKNARRELRDFN